MKSLSLLLIFFGFAALTSKSVAQCCPYIDSIKVQTRNNNYEISTKVITPGSAASRIQKAFFIRNDSIYLSGCYSYGPKAAPGIAIDTFRIGTLNKGTYTIQFKAYLSNNQTSCDSAFSQIKTHAFTVSGITGIRPEKKPENLILYPNPTSYNFRIQGNQIQTIKIYDLAGAILKKVITPELPIIEIDLTSLPKGIYLVEMTDKNGQIQIRKIIKE